METATIEQVEAGLRELSPEELAIVLRFVTSLVERRSLDERQLEADYRAMAADAEHEREALEWIEAASDEALEGMEPALLSEPVLRREWDTPEEDEAWSHL